MNIFALHNDPKKAAQMHCDAHISKMVVESGQMLSTVHRMLDGNETKRLSKSGKRMIKYWEHPDINLELTLYKAVHMNHPCTVWSRESSANYKWHYRLFIELAKEYTHRYSKDHATLLKLEKILANPPQNMTSGNLTPFRLAMKSQPQCMNENDPISSYRQFYQTKQERFNMKWTNRTAPKWFNFLSA